MDRRVKLDLLLLFFHFFYLFFLFLNILFLAGKGKFLLGKCQLLLGVEILLELLEPLVVEAEKWLWNSKSVIVHVFSQFLILCENLLKVLFDLFFGLTLNFFFPLCEQQLQVIEILVEFGINLLVILVFRFVDLLCLLLLKQLFLPEFFALF